MMERVCIEKQSHLHVCIMNFNFSMHWTQYLTWYICHLGWSVTHLYSRTTTPSPASLRSATSVENTNILDLWAFSNDEINFCLHTLALKVFSMNLCNASTEHLDHGVKLWKNSWHILKHMLIKLSCPGFTLQHFLVEINNYKGPK